MALFKAMRGNRAALDAREKHDGYAYFCIDDGTFHIDYLDENGELQRKQLNAKDAETLSGATLVNELTNSELEIPTGAAVMKALDERIVQPDWNQNDKSAPDYIKNRICNTEIYEGQITLTFDGDVSSALDSILYSESGDIKSYYIKLSNNAPQRETMVGATLTSTVGGALEIVPSMLHSIGNIPAYGIMGRVFVFYSDTMFNGIIFSKGIWASYSTANGSSNVTALSYYGTEEYVTKIDGKYLHQSNWNQHDESAVDYIVNKPFGYSVSPVLFNTTLEFTASGSAGYIVQSYSYPLVADNTYLITWDGVDYERVAAVNGTYNYVGNGSLFDEALPDTGEPFFVIGSGPIVAQTVGTHTVEVQNYILNKIDEKFLPEIAATQADWNQNNETAPDYIKNRTHYDNTITVNWDGKNELHYVSPQCLVDNSDETLNSIINSVKILTRWNYYSDDTPSDELEKLVFDDYILMGTNYDDVNNIDSFWDMDAIAVLKDNTVITLHNGTTGTFHKGLYLRYDPDFGEYVKLFVCQSRKQLDEKFIPDTIARTDAVNEKLNKINANGSGSFSWDGMGWYKDNLKIGGSNYDDPQARNVVTDDRFGAYYSVLTDLINGYDYVIEMRNGNLVSRCRYKSISIAQYPDRIRYETGECFDPTGMIVIATAMDGSTTVIDNYSFPSGTLKNDDTEIVISIKEVNTILSTSIAIKVETLKQKLIDFEYITNDDGTYTLTGWNETHFGRPSTECILPDSDLINW